MTKQHTPLKATREPIGLRVDTTIDGGIGAFGE